MTHANADIDVLAKTIYGEARGEYARHDAGLAGLIAVGNVAMNRLKAQSWFGKTLREVCLKPYQFSCWNPNDPNHDKLHSSTVTIEPLFDICRWVAENVAEERWPDLTKGSDHYHTVQVAPKWSKGQKPVIRIGCHVFFKLGGR